MDMTFFPCSQRGSIFSFNVRDHPPLVANSSHSALNFFDAFSPSHQNSSVAANHSLSVSGVKFATRYARIAAQHPGARRLHSASRSRRAIMATDTGMGGGGVVVVGVVVDVAIASIFQKADCLFNRMYTQYVNEFISRMPVAAFNSPSADAFKLCAQPLKLV